ncbi:MAG: recombinase family protein [Nitrososphaerota archaeon]|nr:recombinase family protein [Nitrososphaerota archaeon]
MLNGIRTDADAPTRTEAAVPIEAGRVIPLSQSAALYLRSSTEQQDFAKQEQELRAYAASRNWSVIETYAEAVSGTGRIPGPEYDRLLRDAKGTTRRWRHLLVWALEEFSWTDTFTKATQAILDFEAMGVRFHSFKEPILDTPEDGEPNPGRDVLLALRPVIAAFESKRRSERVRVMMREITEGRRRTRSGRPPGRPRRLTPELAAKVLELRTHGLSWKEVARQAGLPSGTCRKIRPPPSPTATGGVEKGQAEFGTSSVPVS